MTKPRVPARVGKRPRPHIALGEVMSSILDLRNSLTPAGCHASHNQQAHRCLCRPATLHARLVASANNSALAGSPSCRKDNTAQHRGPVSNTGNVFHAHQKTRHAERSVPDCGRRKQVARVVRKRNLLVAHPLRERARMAIGFEDGMRSLAPSRSGVKMSRNRNR